MRLTEQEIDFISDNLKLYGLTSEELHNDVLDHICTYIENREFDDFDTAHKKAIKNFGGYSEIRALQRNAYLETMFRKNMKREKAVAISGFTSSSLICIGMLFKFMHWPFASISLAIGFLLLITTFLPLYFYHRYKLAYIRNS
ncbi:hypothetical protein [Flavobacterium alkalisoli]|nr:hypothetical protein [Flavobacterium alkalisoli]